MLRTTFFEALQTALGVKPEYLWASYPNYAVLRHPGSKKWFAILMDLPPAKLGLPGEGLTDVLVLRCGPALTGSLLAQEGYYPAYHMNKIGWVSTPLGGPVPQEELFSLLTLCYDAVAPKSRRRS